MDLVPLFLSCLLFYFILFFFLKKNKRFLAYKEANLLHCKDGIFGWEDFSPELIKKKYHVEFLDILGFFVVVRCFHK